MSGRLSSATERANNHMEDERRAMEMLTWVLLLSVGAWLVVMLVI